MPGRLSSGPRRVVVEVVVLVAVFAVVAVACGWLWHAVWDPPVGVVVEGRWYPSENDLRAVFDGTGWYCLVGGAAGLVLGALAGWLARGAPVLTLVAVVLSSALAAWLMYVVGTHANPPDPQTLAAGAEDGTRLPGRLSLEGGRSPYLVWPLASLLGLMVANFLGASRDEIRSREAEDPRWLGRNHPG